MRVLSFSETGCVRKNNEDSLLVLPEKGVYAVADGMGGHAAGEVASKIALDQFAIMVSELDGISEDKLEDWMEHTLSNANSSVYNSSIKNPDHEGMGTTLTALVIKDRIAIIGHVGDSRAYLWRENSLKLLTVDHSLVEELVRAGQLSQEEAEKHPNRNMLTRAVGADPKVEADCKKIIVNSKDVFLLCTDGFSNIISEEEIIAEFQMPTTWEERFEKLRQLVIERGAPDNFTVLCCILE